MTNHEQIQSFLPDFVLSSGSSAELPAGISEHVDSCEECQGWLETYELAESVLSASSSRASFRTHHVSSEVLADYALDGSSAAVEEHLEGCGSCRREFELALSSLESVALEGKATVLLGGHPKSRSFRLALIAATLAAAVGLSFWLSGRPASMGPVDYRITEHEFTGRRVLAADSTITVTESTVVDGADVTLRAGNTVSFGDGFSIGNGASFSVEITNDGSPDGSS